MTRQPARSSVLAGALGALLSGALAVTLLMPSGSPPARPELRLAAANPATPGNFAGYGFDKCQAPPQSAMDAWLSTSPYLAVGIYIAGASRGCRFQTYLNAAWVHTQLARGWKLMPLTLGPQASCNPHFPRYGNDKRINPNPRKTFFWARRQGTLQANDTVTAARALGIGPRSTMFYDLEAFNAAKFRCRESALWFLSAWTQRIHQLGYLSGVYSSAASGLKALDDARVGRPGTFHLPDQIWIGDWDHRANTTSVYLRSDGWVPHRRAKQYVGGHNETWGRVRMAVDRDYVDLGRGAFARTVKHCGGVRVDFRTYLPLGPAHKGYRPDHAQVKALKCFLRESGIRTGKLNGVYGAGLRAAVAAWQRRNGFPTKWFWTRHNWVGLFARISNPILKVGSASEAVRNLQRALSVGRPGWVHMTGIYNTYIGKVVKLYQRRHRVPATGIVTSQVWALLRAGRL